MANRTDACFIRVIGSELVQRYVGEGARLVSKDRRLGSGACAERSAAALGKYVRTATWAAACWRACLHGPHLL